MAVQTRNSNSITSMKIEESSQNDFLLATSYSNLPSEMFCAFLCEEEERCINFEHMPMTRTSEAGVCILKYKPNTGSDG